MDLKKELQNIIKGDVLDDKETLTKYSHDASLFEVKPKVVVFPKDSEDIQSLVKYTNENKKKYPDLSITARSAGTDMSGGPLNESIILDFTKYMNHQIAFKGDEIVVQPGMMYRDFEKETLSRGLLMPSYPASKSICAVGGMVANNAAGEKTLKVGRTADYIKELKVVFGDGNEYIVKLLSKAELEKKIAQNDFESIIYKQIWELIQENKDKIQSAKPNVSKNVAGYGIWDVWDSQKEIFDLTRLIIGSQGTLGIVTEITFRLIPVKKYSMMLVVFLNSLDLLPRIVNKALKYKPESMESYDDKTLRLAIRFWPEFAKRKGLLGFIKMAISFIPEFFILLSGGIPKLVILIDFEAEDEKEKIKIHQNLELLDKEIRSFGVKTKKIKTYGGQEKYWDIRRESFNLLRKHVKGKRTAPFIDDIIVRPEHLPEFFPKLNEVLEKYKEYMEYTIAGHAGSGNFHIIPLMDFADPKSQEIILEVSDKVYDLVISYGGSITAEHNDGIIRTPYLEKMYGREVYEIFKNIKNIFDSQNIFNPGKKVGGTKDDIKKHLVKSS